MATNNSVEIPSYTEIAITLFCWWESISASPHVLFTLFGRVPSDEVKARLLSCVNNREFWVMTPFAIFTGFLLLFFLLRKRRELPSLSSTKDLFAVANIKEAKRVQVIKNLERANRRTKIIRALRSLGVSLIKDWVLDKMNVSLYGTFRRPSTWELIWPRFGGHHFTRRLVI